MGLLLSTSLCRYTIRDVAFVDLGGDGWVVRAEVPDGTPEAWASTLKNIARASFADCNVELVVVSAAKGGALAVTLVGPDGRTLALDLPSDVEVLKIHGWDELDAVAASPARDLFRRKCLEAHALVLVFEGKDAEGNARIHRLAKEAITQASPTLAELPKPARSGPEVIAIPFGDRRKERFLHWAVGADAEEPEDAHVVVLYGRGRRMGPVLAGPVVTASAIKQALLLIGQDCECELPRSIMRGAQIPLSWDREQATRAQDVLGFDGRNPMVKQEIARIVAREATSPNAPRAVGVDPLGLGYREEVVTTEPRAPEAVPVEEEIKDPTYGMGLLLAIGVILLFVGGFVLFIFLTGWKKRA